MRRAQSEDEASSKKAKVRRDRWKDKTCTAKGQEKAERQVEGQDLQPQKCGATQAWKRQPTKEMRTSGKQDKCDKNRAQLRGAVS